MAEIVVTDADKIFERDSELYRVICRHLFGPVSLAHIELVKEVGCG